MGKKTKIKWLKDPEEHDYPAAESYLSLIYEPHTASSLVHQLKQSSTVEFKAKDIIRASGQSLYDMRDLPLEKKENRILDGDPLSPLLLVRDRANGKVVIADGYHRLCSVWELDEEALVPCRII
ncbi:MAG: hypothetical protein V4443_05035 [Pseudomonadota bacterium]